MKFEYTQGFTHAGTFHADDVFSTVFLKMLNPNIIIKRGFVVPDDYKGIVFDIGNGEFDHHSADREKRETGEFYASFGKLWRKYANLIVSDFVKEQVDYYFIRELDNSDNTGAYSSLAEVISNMNPFWDEKGVNDISEQNKCFWKAYTFAYPIFARVIEKAKSVERAKDYVLKCYEERKDGLVILDRYANWYSVLKDTETLAVLFPSNREGFILERLDDNKFMFPKEWWGTRGEIDVEGLIFCHASGFMCVFDTLENAKKAYVNLRIGK